VATEHDELGAPVVRAARDFHEGLALLGRYEDVVLPAPRGFQRRRDAVLPPEAA
jgi:hypothetical protein